MDDDRRRKLAKEHSEWFVGVFDQMVKEHSEWFVGVFDQMVKLVFYEAFIHGYGHGFRDAKEEVIS